MGPPRAPDAAFAPVAAVRRATPRVLGTLDERAVRRRPSDIARLLLSVAVLVVLSAVARRVTALGWRSAQLVAELPSPLASVGTVVTDALLVLLVGTGTLVLVAALRRRPRLAASVALSATVAAATVAAATGALLRWFVDSEQLRAASGRFPPGPVPVYPPLAVAVAAAVGWSAAAFLTRPARRLVHAGIALLAVSIVLSGDALGVDVVAGLALAWGTAAAVRLVLGSPLGTPTAQDVVTDLERLGVRATDPRLDPVAEWGITRFDCRDPEGRPLVVEVHGRDDLDARLWSKLWHLLWYRDAGPRFQASRLQQVEHTAYVTLLAERAGLQVPEVLVADAVGGDGDAVLVARPTPGRRLSEVEPDAVTDAVLDATWSAATSLWRARIAHGGLNTAAVVLADDGSVALRDLDRAATSPDRSLLDGDAVELLATTASLVGVDRALDAARRALGDDGLARLEPRLQPGALSTPGRRLTDAGGRTARRHLFDQLRAGAAERTGTEPTELEQLVRVSWGQVVMAALTLLGVYLLVQQITSVGGLRTAFEGTDPGWVVATFVVGQLGYLTQGIATLGTVDTPMRLGRVTILQVAKSFTSLIGGVIGSTATTIRFLQRQGVPLAPAASAGALFSLGQFAAQVLLILVCLPLAGDEFDRTPLSGGGGEEGATTLLIAVVVVGLVVLAIALGLPGTRRWIRDRIVPQVREAAGSVRAIVSSPRATALLVGGQALTQLLLAACLGAALHALGADSDLPALVLVTCLASFLGGISPTPGGLGAVEAGLIAGLTAVGIQEDTAVAAMLLYRTVTAYLPPLWGWAAMTWLREHDEL